MPDGAHNRSEVPEVVVSRLPQYLRVLQRLLDDGALVVNSQQLGERLQVTPAQIRKDLSYFGRFGTQGRGYRVRSLLARLRQILGVNTSWKVAVVGVGRLGRLGRAILNYPGFNPDGFHIVAAFDASPAVVGQEVGGLRVYALTDLQRVAAEGNISISIAIAAVPVEQTQAVVDQLVACGIRAILNYAPISPYVPPGVRLRNIDPVLSLQAMTYYITEGDEGDGNGEDDEGEEE